MAESFNTTRQRSRGIAPYLDIASVSSREWHCSRCGHACIFPSGDDGPQSSHANAAAAAALRLVDSSEHIRAIEQHRQQKMGKKNKKNMRRRAEDDGRDDNDDIIMDENGVIPNGFTIDFDGFDDHAATSSKSGRRKSNTRKNGMNDDDDEGDSSQQAPRGGYGSQVLPFANHLPDDHTGEPLDGHEYLFLVR